MLLREIFSSISSKGKKVKNPQIKNQRKITTKLKNAYAIPHSSKKKK